MMFDSKKSRPWLALIPTIPMAAIAAAYGEWFLMVSLLALGIAIALVLTYARRNDSS